MENKKVSNDSLQDYILVKGDISGIQEFIFNVKSKGAAKSLKGRSFFMKILTEITIQYLFDKFNIDLTNRKDFRISTSGGNFFLKLPSIENHDKIIKDLQLLLSKGLRFSGLNLSLNYVPLDENQYAACLSNLNQKVRENRLKLFSNLDENDFGLLFKAYDRQLSRDIDNKVVRSGKAENNWTKITDKLRGSKYFSLVKTVQHDLRINDDSIELIGYKCLFDNDQHNTQRFELNNYLESIFPINMNGMPKGFEELARKKDAGVEKLGILKMDVDNLGLALGKVNSIREHKDFDHELNLFFNNELKKLINSWPFQNNVYTVTSGGDDSFFVGQWKIILELGKKINEEFHRHFVSKGKELTISAGYIIVPPKFPVIRFAQLAEEALHDAKYKYCKGNICLFGEVISWDMFKKIQSFKSQLEQSVNDKSKGLLAKARQTAIRRIDDDKISMKENWEIAYYLRDLKGRQKETLIKQIGDNIIASAKVKGNTNEKQQLKRNLRLILPIAARLIELEKR